MPNTVATPILAMNGIHVNKDFPMATRMSKARVTIKIQIKGRAEINPAGQLFGDVR